MKRRFKKRKGKSVATHRIEYLPVKHKSRAGVEYEKYIPHKIAIK